MSWIESHGFSIFGAFNLSKLSIDEAWLNVTNFSNQKLWLYELSSDCHECPFKLTHEDFREFNPESSAQFQVPTKFPGKYRFLTNGIDQYVLEDDKRNFICELETSFGEFGVYDLSVSDDFKCNLKTQLEPVNVYLPILIAVLFYVFFGMIFLLFKKYKTRLPAFLRPKIDTNSINAKETEPKKQRLKSLDTFRGLCITIMIFVHDGGAQYYFMEHATWDGLHPTDLVFPWFLWIMGVSIPASIKSQLKRKISKSKIFKRILIRSLKLIVIGVILASKDGPIDIKTFRFTGVLQRFGVCYFIAATSVLLCATDEFVENKQSTNKFIAQLQDVLFVWKGWIVSVTFLVIHILITFFLPVPGCPTGYIGPGGLHKGNAYPEHCIGGATGYIDRQILTVNHIFKWPTALSTYKTGPYDPEGVLGTLTSIFQLWLGVQAGLTLQVYQKPASRILRWLSWAIITGGLGAALCGAKQIGGLIPVNKNLWSLSFVLVTSCFAFVILTVFYIIIDLKKWWSGSPLLEPGMNSMLLYITHTIGSGILPFHFNYKDKFTTHFLKLVESLWGVSLWVLMAIRMHKNKFFWTV